MRRLYLFLLVALAFLASAPAHATLYDYSFSNGTGTQYELTNPTVLWAGGTGGTYYYYNVTSFYIPFYFEFDGGMYDRISVSTSGVLGLGYNDITYDSWNYLYYSSWMPTIAPFWDDLRVSGQRYYQSPSIRPKVQYQVFGTAPNRVLVVEYFDIELQAWAASGYPGPLNTGHWQVRLYEKCGKIEFWYGVMAACADLWGYTYCIWGTSATIGIANNYEWISVTPDGTNAYEHRDWPDDYVDLIYSDLPENTLYTFQPCQINPVADPNVGGSTDSVLMVTTRVKKWDTQSFYPIAIQNTRNSCRADRVWSATITGPNASDYVLPVSTGTVWYGGAAYPEIVFTPTGDGVRRATLTITDDHCFSQSFEIAGQGAPRFDWIPDMNTYDGGGTPGLISGDTLMNGILVPRPDFRDFHPITLDNPIVHPEAPPARIIVRIDSLDEVSSQFVLQTEDTLWVVGGDSHAPIIRFLTLNVGPQEARITIEADGERRWFLMRPISAAPAIQFTANNQVLDQNNPIFQWTETCVGEHATTLPLQIRNIGTMPLIVTKITFWLTDTTDQQGTPPFPLMRDERLRAVPSDDYAFSDIPGVAPIPANSPVTVPFTLQPNESRTIYATFVAQEPGKRFARAYFETNAQNFYGTDTAYGAIPNSIMGLANLDMVGRGLGAEISASPTGLALKPVVFPAIRVGDTADLSIAVANSGACDLRINRARLAIFAGDVNEFKVLSAFTNGSMDANGNFVMAPGASDTIRLRFLPTRSGTRDATLRLVTNDSTVYTEGVSERGTYYLDLYGRGRAGLDGHDLVLDPVVIGSFSTGIARFESTVNTPVEIQSILFDGGDAAEFLPDASAPWPALPHTVLPGGRLELGVRLTPVGDPGLRTTTLLVVSSTGDTAQVLVRGEAGTQDLLVNPASLFDDVLIGVGQAVRRSVVISNAGTLPVRITSVQISGPDAANYRLGRMPRVDLFAGATEYLEVTYAPQAMGQSSAQLDIVAAGKTYTVLLGGESAIAYGGGQPETGANRDVGDLSSPAGVIGEASIISSVAVRPNPAVDEVTLSFGLTTQSSLTVEIYSASGAMVKRAAIGTRGVGSHESSIDVSGLATGVYRFVLASTNGSVKGSFTIAR